MSAGARSGVTTIICCTTLKVLKPATLEVRKARGSRITSGRARVAAMMHARMCCSVILGFSAVR